MSKHQNRGVAKRDEIITAAGELFAANGYERTTFAIIAKASGAAIGSIEHFFGSKPGLARAVHEDVVDRFVTRVVQALKERPHHLVGTVNVLLESYFRWVKANPHHHRILEALADHAAEDGQTRANGLQARVEPLLLEWVTKYMTAGEIKPLTATQLFALMLAPAIASATSPTNGEEEQAGNSQAWPSLLETIVVKAIAQPVSRKAPDIRSGAADKGKTSTPPTRSSG